MNTFNILTLGCKVNQYESEAIAELFEKNNYRRVSEDDISDVYIVNTCTVTNLSDRKSRQFIRRAKKVNENAIVVVAGCYSQVAEEEVLEIEDVDIVVGTENKTKILELVENFRESREKLSSVTNLKEAREFDEYDIEFQEEMTRAYMKVQDGCNMWCSYCIIPRARGPIRSRSIENSVREAKRLAESGYREVILTGIHIGSYGVDLGEERLIDLIEAISKIEDIKRIRLSSIEPGIITDEFLQRGLKTGKLCDHFHLSLQNGSDRILKLMNRKYTTDEYASKVELIRKYMPYAGITTDIIVGFPGETDEDFKRTMEFVDRVDFSRIHVFKYSPRKGTVAAKMKDQVDGVIKNIRSAQLISKGEKLMEKFLEKNMGRELSVLFEEKSHGEYYEGYSTNYIRIHCNSEKNLKNTIKDVKIVGRENEIAIGKE